MKLINCYYDSQKPSKKYGVESMGLFQRPFAALKKTKDFKRYRILKKLVDRTIENKSDLVKKQ